MNRDDHKLPHGFVTRIRKRRLPADVCIGGVVKLDGKRFLVAGEGGFWWFAYFTLSLVPPGACVQPPSARPPGERSE